MKTDVGANVPAYPAADGFPGVRLDYFRIVVCWKREARPGIHAKGGSVNGARNPSPPGQQTKRYLSDRPQGLLQKVYEPERHHFGRRLSGR